MDLHDPAVLPDEPLARFDDPDVAELVFDLQLERPDVLSLDLLPEEPDDARKRFGGEERGELPADGVLFGVAPDLEDALVDVLDPALAVDDVDQVVGVLHDVAEDLVLLVFGLFSPEGDLDGGGQLRDGGGLGEETVGADGAGAVDGGGVFGGGKEDDRDVERLLDEAGGVDAVGRAGHEDIHQDDVGPEDAGLVDGLGAGGGPARDLKAQRGQGVGELGEHELGVVDD